MSDPRLALAKYVNFFDAGRTVLGGTPRRLSRLGKPTQDLMLRLRHGGPNGVLLRTQSELSIAQVLIDRGLAHPLPPDPELDYQPEPDLTADTTDVEIVIPTRDRVAQVERLLASLDRPGVVVVDDASDRGEELAAVVQRHRGRLVRHSVNTGPAGARNTGIRNTKAPFIAFLDSDCVASPDWPTSILFHFEDPRVAMVASRVLHRGTTPTPDAIIDRLIDDYETCHGALDAGPDPGTVGPTSSILSAPSAAIVLRRSAVEHLTFNEDLRIGEDLDLIWRLCASGWVIRHEPRTTVEHESMIHFTDWIHRRYEYGTFAGPIDKRHPGKVNLSIEWWALPMAALFVAGHPALAASVGASRLARRWWSIRSVPDAAAIAATITGQEISQEWQDLSLTLRGVLWPVGATAVLGSAISPAARRASMIVLAPIVWELITHRPGKSALAHTLLGALREAATGTGVAVSLARSRRFGAFLPRVRLPTFTTVFSR